MDPSQVAEAAAFDAETQYELFESTGNPGHLNQALASGSFAANVIPVGHPLRPGLLSNLSVFCQSHCRNSGQVFFAEEAVRVAQQAVELTAEDDPARAQFLDTLGNALELHFMQTTEQPLLERSITASRDAVRLCGDEPTARAATLNGLSNKLTLLYKHTTRLGYLEEAIRLAREVVAITPENHSDRPAYMTNLASKLNMWIERTDKDEDLKEAVAAAEQAVELTPADTHLQLAGRLNNLGLLLLRRYTRAHETIALEKAIGSLQRAVSLTSTDHADRPGWLDSLGIGLKYRFEKSGDPEDLNAAVRSAQTSTQTTPPGHVMRVDRLEHLASVLELRYQADSDEEDLKTAISTARELSSLASARGQKQARHSILLSRLILESYKKSDAPEDLEEGIRETTEVIRILSQGDVELPTAWKQLAICFEQQHRSTGTRQDLDKSIEAWRTAISHHKAGSVEWAICMGEMGDLLANRYRERWDPQDLSEAIESTQKAVEVIPTSHTQRASLLDRLGRQTVDKWSRTGSDASDLEKAVGLLREAISLVPEESPDRASYLNNLAGILELEYSRTGNQNILEQSIRQAQAAMALEPQNRPESASSLINLANTLQRLFEHTGEVHYINEAVRIAQEAVDLTPENHMNLTSRLNNLGSKHGRRYLRLGDTDDLKTSIRIGRRVVHNVPRSDKNYNIYVNNFINRLEENFRREKCSESLDEAIRLAENSICCTPEATRGRVNCVSTLGVLLDHRYHRDKKQGCDNERAIKLAREVVNSTPVNHPDRAVFLIRLANSLLQCAEPIDQDASLSEALQCYLRATEQPFGLATTRFEAMRMAIHLLSLREDWAQATMVAEAAVKLMPRICTRYASRQDQQYAVTQTAGIASDACTILLKAGEVEKAVELLELGRGLILGYTIDNLDDLSSLESTAKVLAQQYRTLRTQASMPFDGWDDAERERLLKQRREAVYAIEACIDDIRDTVPGYSRFLRGPSIEEIRSHAINGPIVIVNVTDMGSDAIIIAHDGVKSIPLPTLSPATAPFSIRNQFQRYKIGRRGGFKDRDIPSDDSDDEDAESDQLTWLWEHCVKPVLSGLVGMGLASLPGDNSPKRVWWIGAGIAGRFPFHAAGNASESALDSVISSYTPTVKALGYARERARRNSNHRESVADDESVGVRGNKNTSRDNTILVVTMATTPGRKPLEGAEREGKVIETVVTAAAARATASNADPSSRRQASLRVLPLPQPSADKVLAHIASSVVAHFACHGYSDSNDPSRSHLLLQRQEAESGKTNNEQGSARGNPVVDRLTVARLAKVVAAQSDRGEKGNGGPRIAFLSACSTAEVKAQGLGDEGLHLASAFQMTGFSGVIGSLWTVDDDICVSLAEAFYSKLLSTGTEDDSDEEKTESEEARASFGEGLGNDWRVAEALRHAVMLLKVRYPENPHVWVPFVYFGA